MCASVPRAALEGGVVVRRTGRVDAITLSNPIINSRYWYTSRESFANHHDELVLSQSYEVKMGKR